MTGDELQAALANPPAIFPPLIADLLYTQSVFMLTGETGKGKSVIATQIALSLTSATSVFGSLEIPTPRRVYYMQMEGSESEQLNRLRYMQQSIPIDPTHLYWDAKKKTRLNCLDAHSLRTKLTQIDAAFASPPDLITIDPIYRAVPIDLAKAEAAIALANVTDLFMERYGCSILLIHHPHRTRFDQRGKQIQEDDAYYGHSFLKNHVDTSYTFEQLSDDGSLSRLVRKKLREERSLPELSLVYHPETYTCSMTPQPTAKRKRELVEAYLASLKGRQTDFYEVKRVCSISTTFLRELQAEFRSRHLLEVAFTDGQKGVWKPAVDGWVSADGVR